VILYWGGMSFSSIGAGIGSILKVVAIIVIIVLVKNTNPRMRIRQIMKFFWGPLTVIAIIGLILAMNGL